ncbi:MAG: 8-oxoguanine deaminase [Deltaproteobacteria bacterium]|nr:8-oxoguanine deaminase [Deltaproteobacteria bacterium]
MARGRLLLRNIYHLAVGDDANTRLRGVDLLVDGSRIADIGPSLPRGEAEVIDASTKLVIPGLVNTHHHMYQTLQRNLPAVQNAGLFDWLKGLYPIWRYLTAEVVSVSTQLACAELLKTGCTTTSDHHYIFPAGVTEDLIGLQVQAALETGIRICTSRGSMSRGESQGGLPPDSVVQDERTILEDSARVIAAYHDPSPFSRQRVALAPCSPFSVTEKLMAESAALARRHGVRLHTHLAETLDEETYCVERYGCRPLALMERVGWLGPDVWFAHGIHFDDAELEVLARTGTGVAHCPSSNMRLGSGICRVPELLARGVRVGLAVDGSASNDSSNMLGELRSCLLVHRVHGTPAAMTADLALRLATRGSAELLGWERLGTLAVGQAADLALVEMKRLDYAGALSDPLAAAVFAGISHNVHTTIVDGKVVVSGGRLVCLDEDALRDRANALSKRMLEQAGHSTKWML